MGKLLHVSLSVELRLKRSLPVSFEHVAKELEAIVQDLFNLFYVLGSQKSNGTPAHVGTYHSSEKCVCLLEHPPFYHGLAAVHHRALELSYRFRGLL